MTGRPGSCCCTGCMSACRGRSAWLEWGELGASKHRWERSTKEGVAAQATQEATLVVLLTCRAAVKRMWDLPGSWEKRLWGGGGESV